MTRAFFAAYLTFDFICSRHYREVGGVTSAWPSRAHHATAASSGPDREASRIGGRRARIGASRAGACISRHHGRHVVRTRVLDHDAREMLAPDSQEIEVLLMDHGRLALSVLRRRIAACLPKHRVPTTH